MNEIGSLLLREDSGSINEEELLEKFCKYAKNREYFEILKKKYNNRVKINIDKDSALEFSKQLVEVETRRLLDIL